MWNQLAEAEETSSTQHDVADAESRAALQAPLFAEFHVLFPRIL